MWYWPLVCGGILLKHHSTVITLIAVASTLVTQIVMTRRIVMTLRAVSPYFCYCTKRGTGDLTETDIKM